MRISNNRRHAIILLSIIFPSVLDLYYKENKDLYYQCSIVFKAGYNAILSQLQEDRLKEISLLIIEYLKTLKLTKIEVLLLFDTYIVEYSDYVKHERKYLWQQMKNLIDSNDKYIEFLNSLNFDFTSNYKELDKIEVVKTELNKFMKMRF